MCYHFEKYSSKAPNHIALSCLFIGYEMTKDNKCLNNNEKEFILEWLRYLFDHVGKDEEVKNESDKLYQDIYETFVQFKGMGYKNLIKRHGLFFE